MLVDSSHAPGSRCQPLNFCFTGKTEHFDILTENQRTLLRSQRSKLQLFFFYFSQQLLNFCLDFFNSSKNAQKFESSENLATA